MKNSTIVLSGMCLVLPVLASAGTTTGNGLASIQLTLSDLSPGISVSHTQSATGQVYFGNPSAPTSWSYDGSWSYNGLTYTASGKTQAGTTANGVVQSDASGTVNVSVKNTTSSWLYYTITFTASVNGSYTDPNPGSYNEADMFSEAQFSEEIQNESFSLNSVVDSGEYASWEEDQNGYRTSAYVVAPQPGSLSDPYATGSSMLIDLPPDETDSITIYAFASTQIQNTGNSNAVVGPRTSSAVPGPAAILPFCLGVGRIVRRRRSSRPIRN